MHELFEKRRSIRKFLKKPVSDLLIKEILLAAMTAPSAMDNHPLDFIVVKEKEILEKLSQAGLYVDFIGQAAVAIVVVSDPTKSQKFWLVDASIAAGYIYLEATSQGLGTCWANIYQSKLEDGSDREVFVKKILKVPADKRIVCILPLGYPAEKRSPHSEKEFVKTKVHQGEW